MRSCPAGLFSQLQSDDLLVEHYIFLFYDHVLMVVAEKPVFELAPFFRVVQSHSRDKMSQCTTGFP